MALGRVRLGEGKKTDLTQAVNIFREVLRKTEGREELRAPHSSAACGWAQAAIGQARDALRDAKAGLGDIKHLRSEKSEFLKALDGAKAALGIAAQFAPDEASRLQGELNQLVSMWGRDVEPRLNGSR